MAKKSFIPLSKNSSFISEAVAIIDVLCPIKDCPAKKYTNHDYLLGILEIFEKFTYWRTYEGQIKWKTLNDKFNYWCNHNIFNKIHKHLLSKYLKKNKTKKLKYQIIDSTSIANKQGSKFVKHNGFTGRKRYIKVSSITDIFGIPLGIYIFPGSESDINTISDTIDKIPIDTDTKKHCNNNRYKQYLLADSGYCSKDNRLVLKELGYNPLIWFNIRNTRDETKITKFNKKQTIKYIQRKIIESSFAWLKKFPKINCLYEKNISSFYGFILIGCCYIISNYI
jgi:DDE family transposase